MLDPVRIRFRTDGWFMADDAATFVRGEKMLWHHTPDELIGTEPAQPGDIWRSQWHRAEGEGPIAGYAICCPKCLHVHAWCSASNCNAPRRTFSWTDDQGVEHQGSVCIHSGEGSCWTWTGNAEDGTLSASPSLHCAEALGGCGWHGHLTNGVMKHC